MELTCDWRLFQTLFYPARRTFPGQTTSAKPGSLPPAYIVVDGDRIITAIADQEDLSDWIGSTPSELQTELGQREIVRFDRAAVDQWVKDSLNEARFYDQVEQLRRNAKPTQPVRSFPPASATQHFLLRALQGWWGKVLPSAYGIYIRVNGRAGPGTEQDFILVVRRGVFEAFHQPDFSGLPLERRRDSSEVIRYLSSRYFVPVQGVSVAATDWNEWAHQADPWSSILRSVRAERTQLFPSRWSLSALIAAKALF